MICSVRGGTLGLKANQITESDQIGTESIRTVSSVAKMAVTKRVCKMA